MQAGPRSAVATLLIATLVLLGGCGFRPAEIGRAHV